LCGADLRYGSCDCTPVKPDADVCSVAGQKQSCACAGAQTGTQLCGADLRYGSCDCTPVKPDADVCSAAGQQQTCMCAGPPAGSGTQTCGADLRYGACTCIPGKRVFVTSTTYSGNLLQAAGAADGLAAGDKLCTQAAQAAALGGTWKAWLSVKGTDAKTRMAGVVGGWYLLDGTKVFNNAANLTTQPLANIRMTEQKTVINSGTSVWTGTLNGGAAGPSNCLDWTATIGPMGTSPVATIGDAVFASNWTDGSTLFCSSSARLYCFEQ